MLGHGKMMAAPQGSACVDAQSQNENRLRKKPLNTTEVWMSASPNS